MLVCEQSNTAWLLRCFHLIIFASSSLKSYRNWVISYLDIYKFNVFSYIESKSEVLYFSDSFCLGAFWFLSCLLLKSTRAINTDGEKSQRSEALALHSLVLVQLSALYTEQLCILSDFCHWFWPAFILSENEYWCWILSNYKWSLLKIICCQLYLLI